MSVSVAFKAFFAALFDRQAAQRIAAAIAPQAAIPATTAPAAGTPPTTPTTARAAAPSEPAGRSEALTLLATLQRESRLLDLVHESLDAYEDAQIGAASREVLRDCRKSLERMFALAPVAEAEEGDSLQLPSPASPAKYRLLGSGDRATAVITHRGWQATRCEVPQWNGQRDEKLLLAPIELE